jgi:hypothetical protein
MGPPPTRVDESPITDEDGRPHMKCGPVLPGSYCLEDMAASSKAAQILLLSLVPVRVTPSGHHYVRSRDLRAFREALTHELGGDIHSAVLDSDDELLASAEHAETSGVVYFAQGEPSTPIKIGTSVNAKNRLNGLRTGSPVPLRLLATTPGGRRRERELHKQFASYRTHGEWFAAGPDLLAFITGLR